MTEELVGPAATGVTEIEIDGCISVYSPTTSEVLMLNRSASDIWMLADGTMTIDALAEALADRYGVGVAAIFDEVSLTVATLHDARVLASG